MGKLHVLLKKEELDAQRLDDSKIVVVFDILLATSTITAALHYGAREVVPVIDGAAAMEEAAQREKGGFVLAGEYQGVTIEGFLAPYPQGLKQKVAGKSVVLSTTNGTVAIRKAVGAKMVYTASMLNTLAVVQHLLESHKDETILLVCAGSSGEFNIEDFYGAGYFIDALTENSRQNWKYTDASFAAHEFYKGAVENGRKLFHQSSVGKMIGKHGFEEEVDFVLQKDIYPIASYVNSDLAVIAEQIKEDGSEVHAVHGNQSFND
ncbi:2-phosphosulfolactate phosphatase [Virgibacillus xinjiangensis]|uniref:Probable 2-phosphosulfolactate phosphatase n=1 Tax=Virgibacillus xinjiangensis TaxID=393090 RepID=A0ABV7D0A5_9BACI